MDRYLTRDRIVFAIMAWTWCGCAGTGHWVLGIWGALLIGRYLDLAATVVQRMKARWRRAR